MKEKLKMDTGTSQEDAQYVRNRLLGYNSAHLSEDSLNAPREDLHIFLKDENGTILGGITGFTKLNCYHIEIFWIDESLRGQGVGSEMIRMAEKAGAEKGCTLIKLDTFSFQAPVFYQKVGFTIYGQLEDFPEKGQTHYYLYKRIK